MIAKATLCHHNTREWMRFWFEQSAQHEPLTISFDKNSAHVFDEHGLIAEFTPENTREFITETLKQLRGN